MVLMGWPVAADYDEAIQNPHLNFVDAELKSGEPDYDQYGSPAVRCGNFASVYLVRTATRKVAVRCFLREVKDQQERYAAISHDLLSLGLPYTVPFEFVEKGIKVQGSWFPILKMDWCDGDLLDRYIEKNLNDPNKLRRLSDKWFEMSVSLRKQGIAHGDLQHGNVLVLDDEIKLIDYDGMFVPRLAGRQSNERGLEHYQHPKRDDHHYGRYLDSFSNWVIYTTLFALSSDPSLWSLINLEDKHLIFKRSDYDNPDASKTFQLLKKHDDRTIRTYATTVENLIAYDVEKVPEFHPDKPVLYPPSSFATVPAKSPGTSVSVNDKGGGIDDDRGGDRGGLYNEKRDTGSMYNDRGGDHGDRGDLVTGDRGDVVQRDRGDVVQRDRGEVIQRDKVVKRVHPGVIWGGSAVAAALVGVLGWVGWSMTHQSNGSDVLRDGIMAYTQNQGAEGLQTAISRFNTVHDDPSSTSAQKSKADCLLALTALYKAGKYGDASQLDAAISWLNRAIKEDPTNEEAFYVRARAYAQKGDVTDSKLDIEEALRLNPNMANQPDFAKFVNDQKK